MLPFLFPFDWTQRQVYWMALCFWMASIDIADARTLEAWLVVFGWALGGVLGITLEYLCKPSPEFWLSAWLEYLAILTVSCPLWWRRLLPLRRGDRDGLHWPLAVMPHWLGCRLVAPGEVLEDGTIRIPDPRPRRPANFAVVLGIQPRPHPDLLPMQSRATIIQVRLNIFKNIRGRWSLHLQVRPFNEDALEVASGPAWGWVKLWMAPNMVMRRPALVLYGEDQGALKIQADAILDRFRQGNMTAWRQTAAETRRLAGELWTDIGLSTQRVRIGLRRVVTGNIGYRSWALTALPRIIHLAWLRPLTSESLLCDLAIHVSVRRPGPTRRSLQRNIRQWRAVDQDQDYALAESDAQRTIDAMRRGLDTQATVAVYVTARQEQATKVSEALESAQCEFRPANFMQHRALRATRTLGGDPLSRTMKADLRTVAATDLLATAGYWPEGATLIGEAISAPEPIGINLFDEQNLNWAMFIAMMQGSGKTTFAQTLAWRMANPHPHHPLWVSPIQIVSVDFKASGDYAQLYKHLEDRGHQASYNAWSGGALPPLRGHMGFNLSDVPEDQHGDKLVELTERLEEWATAHSLDHQLLLLLDEILAMLEARGGPAFIRRFGTQGRSLNIAPVFMTQDIEPVLANRKAALAFKNCAHVFVGRQSPAATVELGTHLKLDDDAQTMLESSPQGAGLLRIERKDGPVALALQVRPTTWEIQEFGTNPTERARRWRESLRSQVLDEERLMGAQSNGHGAVSTRDLVPVGRMEVEDLDS